MATQANMISVIVPVYNTEKYLDQCIQSVLAQTYTNWELLLIDDGSTDSSGAICDKYANRDNRIRVVHKPNTGVSDSKNIALDMAQGEYVMFLDSDDFWCTCNCLEKLYATSNELDVDIVRGEYKAVDVSGEFLFERVINQTKQKAITKVLTPYQFLTNAIQGEFFLVLSLFKKNVVSSIRFSERVFLEDVEFYIRCLIAGDVKCSYIPLCFYAYRKHGAAVSNKRTLRKLTDSFSLSYFYHDCESKVADLPLKLYFRHQSIMLYFHTMGTVATNSHFRSRKSIIKALDLVQMQKDIATWISTSPKCYFSPVFYLPPSVGVWYMRGRNFIFDTIYRIRKYLRLT